MTVWSHLSTIFNRRSILRLAVILSLCVALITTLFFSAPSHATAGINQTIGFQGRLLDSNGNVVPDGTYNIQFKIYQDGSGTTAGDSDGGSLKWTETYVNNGGTGGVDVKNGYLSVNLGSITPFGTSIDWNQDTLWLSMNVAGKATSCTTFGTSPCVADGEMLPMKRLTTTPYAMNAGKLGGIDSSGYIHNSTTQQTADLNISGTAQASTIQGNTSVLGPLLDTSVSNGTLSIGTSNSSDITIGNTGTVNNTVSINTGSGNRTTVLGSTSGTSATKIQGGDGGVSISTSATGGFALHDVGNNYNPLAFVNGNFDFNLGSSSLLKINDFVNNQTVLQIGQNQEIYTGTGSALNVRGSATFSNGITIQGTGTYTTPGGYGMQSAINIPNYTVPAYSSIFAFGLPSSSAATARGMIVADGRTSAHQATIGVLSPDENSIMGLSWNGSNSTGTISNTANSLALQGNGLNLLTATNNSGAANVGIGNDASAGYALDVTGDINTSTSYKINGVSTLDSSSLTFSGATAASIASANGQLLNINGKAGVNIQSNGTTLATYAASNVQIGSGSGSGSPILFSLDKASSAPTVDSSMVGSMYYDTTIGKVQCYEADGWGACSANPDHFVTLSPQYSGAVLHGTDPGTLTTDFCSDGLGVNNGSSSQPSICGTNETYNYYGWTSAQSSTATKSIYVTYKLPSDFSGFVAGSTSLMGKTDSSDSEVSYRVYRSTPTGLVNCGTSGTSVSTGSQTTWQKGVASTQDPANCSFAAGDSIVFKINLDSKNNANAYLSDLSFAFKNTNN